MIDSLTSHDTEAPSHTEAAPIVYPRLDEAPSTLQQSIMQRAIEAQQPSRFTRQRIIWVWVIAALLAIVPITLTLGTADFLVRLMYRVGAMYTPSHTQQTSAPADTTSSDPDVVILQPYPATAQPPTDSR